MKYSVIAGAVSCALVALGLAACRPDMTGADQMVGEVADARAELAAHHDATQAASSLPDLRLEVGRHEAAWGEIMAGMMDAMADMGMCGAMAEMQSMMDDMHGIVTHHDAELDAATVLGTGQAACDTYVLAMNDELDSMMGTMDQGGCMMQ
ncbi:MAG: hypothetical protein IT373_06125 [Polyangiaceae bacterium]|nr:hypothetical protein [Polyangiaceae bacterium]